MELLDDAGRATRVVFCPPFGAADVPVAHRLVSQRQPRMILIMVGAGPRARWSIEVADESTEDTPNHPS
jgi:hypothetical protein